MTPTDNHATGASKPHSGLPSAPSDVDGVNGGRIRIVPGGFGEQLFTARTVLDLVKATFDAVEGTCMIFCQCVRGFLIVHRAAVLKTPRVMFIDQVLLLLKSVFSHYHCV